MEKKEKRTLYILYVLGIYILFQAGWWAYHLVELNKELYEYKSILTGVNLVETFDKKVWMIIGEGSIFLILLAIGFWQIKRTLTRELKLAQMEKTFLLSVTHELKTPIAAVKLFLETLKSRKLEPDQERKIVEDALKENKRIEQLSENILLATKLDQTKKFEFTENVEISAIALQTAKRFQSYWPDRSIITKVEDNLCIPGDVQMIQTVLSNLVENAIKYSKPDEAIEIHLSKLNDTISLTVADQGMGIPANERQRVFTKFYRIGNENTRKTKGTGLGLYIIKNIVKLHGGSIEIVANNPKGSRFNVYFPIQI